MNIYMLSSYNEECCINPGICLDITPCFGVFFTGFCTARQNDKHRTFISIFYLIINDFQ